MTTSVLCATSVLCCAVHVADPFRSSVQFVSAQPRIQHAAPALQFGGKFEGRRVQRRSSGGSSTGWGGSSAQVEPLDLTEENVEQVLLDARSELLQLFDVSVGITGVVQLVELDGPFVKLRLTGRFWHERSMVLARVANYLQKRIPARRGFQLARLVFFPRRRKLWRWRLKMNHNWTTVLQISSSSACVDGFN